MEQSRAVQEAQEAQEADDWAKKLCDPCKACVKFCGKSFPDWLGQQSYMNGMSGMMFYDSRPQHTHTSHVSFVQAAMGGCFICRELFSELFSELQSSTLSGSRPQIANVSFKMQFLATEEFGCRLIFTVQLARTSTQDPAELTQKFLLGKNTANSKISVQQVPSGSTESEASFSFVSRALAHCLENHTACRLEASQTNGRLAWYPTRLIDVGGPAAKRSGVKIIETATSLPQGPYLTLSHCWGAPATVFKLTSLNKSNLLQSLPILPPIFEDAICCTQRLGIRYLWVDCICILQDSLKDWEKESSLMASVYGNSLCTLAATASCNSQGGLFRKRSKFGLGICAEDEDDTMLLVSEGAANKMLSDIEKAPLQKRGWVLQERLLSRRMIHFTRQQLVWQCEELNACEALSDGFSVSSIKLPVKLGVKIGSRAPDIDLLEAWDGILSRYTSASLTRRSDLLPALSGIATHLQELTGAAYLAGIWNLHPESFLMHLGWRSEPPTAHRSKEYRAPSWSWASTENRIKLFPFEYDRDFYTIEMMSLNVAAGSKVIRADVVPVSKDPHGSVSAGMLILEGPLNEIVVRPGIKNPDLNGTPLGMEIFLDEPLSTEKTLFTLPLYNYYVPHLDLELGDDGTELIFLLLLRGDENYTRCGVGRWFWTNGVNYPDIWDKIVTTCSNPFDEDYKSSNRKEVHIV